MYCNKLQWLVLATVNYFHQSKAGAYQNRAPGLEPEFLINVEMTGNGKHSGWLDYVKNYSQANVRKISKYTQSCL
jgi:hypothetical protein